MRSDSFKPSAPFLSRLRLLGIAVFGLGLSIVSIKAQDVLPEANRVDWAQAGVPGGIPNRGTIYTTLTPGATSSQIQTALNNCPSGQVVFLNEGTYSLTASLKINRDGVTLRGAVNSAGEPTTVLNFSSTAGGWGLIDLSKTTYPTNPSNVRNIVSGLSRGSRSIGLDTAPTGLQVGQVLALDQVADDAVVWNNGTEGGGTWGRNGDRTLTQFVRVTAISGNNVSFEPGLYSSYWNAARSPQVYWWGSGTSQTVKLSGIENLKINRPSGGSGTHNVAMGPADSCWLKNIWSTQCNSAHVRTGWTLNCEIRDCSFTRHDSVASATYSVWTTFTSAIRVENNIMYNTPCAVGMMSTSGSAIAYNYGTIFPYSQADWLPECVMTHGGHCNHNLFEGNFVPSFWADWIHGNASFNTYARNRVIGWESGKTGSTRPINIQENQDALAVIGNVLGTSGYHDVYQSTSSNRTIFNVNSDSLSSLIRKGNWNSVNNSVPAAEALGSATIQDSYLYSSKPAWFGDRPWPPVKPEDTTAAVVTAIPAGYRYQNGTFPPQNGNLPPIAAASATPTTGDAPLAVVFSSAGSLDPESATLSYSWTFGDGATSNAANPNHTYATAGTYVARLTVSDGVNSIVSSNITINALGNRPPIAAADGNPKSGAAPLAVTFSSAGSSDPDGGTLTYAWTFGDGGTSTAANPAHTFSAPGTYSARLTVSDGVNTVQSTVVTISVSAANGLVAAYGFDEGSGTVAGDGSGSGNQGSIQGATWTSSGRFGKALSFNGTSSLVRIANSPSFVFSNGVTVEAWVNPSAIGGWRDIVYKEDDFLALEASTSQGPPSFGGVFSSTPLYGSQSLQTNRWYHVAGTYDGATMRLYVDGVLVASRAETKPIGSSTGSLSIGGDLLYSQYFAGLIDEVRIYNRALTSAEIAADKDKSVTPPPKPPSNLRLIP